MEILEIGNLAVKIRSFEIKTEKTHKIKKDTQKTKQHSSLKGKNQKKQVRTKIHLAQTHVGIPEILY